MSEYIDINVVTKESPPRDQAKATSRCKICDRPIGFDREFVNDPDVEGLVHLSCLEGETAPRI